MSMILGIDIGGSTTKIVALEARETIVDAVQVRADDQITSLYGAVGRLLHQCRLSPEEVSNIVLTGVGASLIDRDIYGIPTAQVKEFEAIGRGGLQLSGYSEALVVSMGTGTAFVQANTQQSRHIGGTGIGGGTLLGLSSRLVGETRIDALVAMAQQGRLDRVDLTIGEISTADISSLPPTATASNFGNIKSDATSADMVLGLMNTIYQTVGMLAVFACMNSGLKQIVVTGSLAALPQAGPVLDAVGDLYGLDFLIPERAVFATALGAASLYFDQ